MHKYFTINKHLKKPRDFHVVPCDPNHQCLIHVINTWNEYYYDSTLMDEETEADS